MVQFETRRMSGEAFCAAGIAGVGLYVILVMWCREHGSDGHVPAVMVERWHRDPDISRRKVIDRLLRSKLLIRDGNDYRIVDYPDCAETVAEVAEQQARSSVRSKAARLRPSIIRRDGLTCRICGHEVSPADVHVDHLHPVSKGGPSEPNNLRVTHRWCNLSKGAS